MELRQLQYLVAVADEGSFTRAAASAHVAQPGVSAQVRSLERELGHVLLDRSGGRVRATEVGAAVLPLARAALAAVAGMRGVADEFAGLIRGHVTVGVIGTISAPELDLPGLLARFHGDHPNVEITLSEADSASLLSRLRLGHIDVAVVALGAAPPAGVATEIVVSEPLVAAVSPDDALARRTTISLNEIRDRVLVSLPPGTGVRTCLDEACANLGFRPRISFEASNPRIVAQLAARGLGTAILPESVTTAHADSLRAITLTRPVLRASIALAWRADSPVSPAAKAFISCARRLLRGVPSSHA